MWRVNGTTFTSIPIPSDMLTGVIYAVRFSSTGKYFALGSDVSPYLAVYKVNGEIFNRIADLPVLPAGSSNLSWNIDDTLLYISNGLSSPPMIIYKITSGKFEKIPDPPSLPSGSYNGSFSPDGKYLSMAVSGSENGASPYIHTYSIDKDLNFVKIPNPAVMPNRHCYGTSWHPSGKYVTLFHNRFPNLHIWKIVDGIFIRQSFNLPTSGTSDANVVEATWSPDGRFFAATSYYSPYFYVYETTSDKPGGISLLIESNLVDSTVMVSPPTATGSSGEVGMVAVDSSSFYVCTDANTWRRAALSTW
jgi:WD40 repeat protein